MQIERSRKKRTSSLRTNDVPAETEKKIFHLNDETIETNSGRLYQRKPFKRNVKWLSAAAFGALNPLNLRPPSF
jgi:hypothetical protein